jgi:hypothetical protein
MAAIQVTVANRNDNDFVEKLLDAAHQSLLSTITKSFSTNCKYNLDAIEPQFSTWKHLVTGDLNTIGADAVLNGTSIDDQHVVLVYKFIMKTITGELQARVADIGEVPLNNGYLLWKKILEICDISNAVQYFSLFKEVITMQVTDSNTNPVQHLRKLKRLFAKLNEGVPDLEKIPNRVLMWIARFMLPAAEYAGLFSASADQTIKSNIDVLIKKVEEQYQSLHIESTHIEPPPPVLNIRPSEDPTVSILVTELRSIADSFKREPNPSKRPFKEKFVHGTQIEKKRAPPFDSCPTCDEKPCSHYASKCPNYKPLKKQRK